MKLLIIMFAFNAIYLTFIEQAPRALAQDFEHPTMTFKKFEFERKIRGGFNLSTCLTDLLTCQETLIKPDVVCWSWKQYASACGIMNDGCDDDLGYVNDLYWVNQPLYENTCYPT